MKENRVITVMEAKTRDRRRLFSGHSASTCCVTGAKTDTKGLNFKPCSLLLLLHKEKVEK